MVFIFLLGDNIPMEVVCQGRLRKSLNLIFLINIVNNNYILAQGKPYIRRQIERKALQLHHDTLSQLHHDTLFLCDFCTVRLIRYCIYFSLLILLESMHTGAQ